MRVVLRQKGGQEFLGLDSPTAVAFDTSPSGACNQQGIFRVHG